MANFFIRRPIVAMVIAIHFGLSLTLASAAAAYIVAALCSNTWKGRELKSLKRG